MTSGREDRNVHTGFAARSRLDPFGETAERRPVQTGTGARSLLGTHGGCQVVELNACAMGGDNSSLCVSNTRSNVLNFRKQLFSRMHRNSRKSAHRETRAFHHGRFAPVGSLARRTRDGQCRDVPCARRGVGVRFFHPERFDRSVAERLCRNLSRPTCIARETLYKITGVSSAPCQES